MKSLLLATLLATTSLTAFADDTLKTIQDEWALCQYQSPAKDKENCLAKLSTRADAASTAAPKHTELLIWAAIVKSSWAGAKGGLGALGLVKAAKIQLETAIGQNEMALDGSALTSLGSLYYQVPGWPIGFGDDEKAEKLLKKALTINPAGIDPNFFYGDYLLEQGRTDEARRYLQKALAAPARPGRELADQGRRKEIEAKLAKL